MLQVHSSFWPVSENAKDALHEKCPNTEIFLVRSFPYLE